MVDFGCDLPGQDSHGVPVPIGGRGLALMVAGGLLMGFADNYAMALAGRAVLGKIGPI